MTLLKSGLAGSSVQHTILWPAVRGGPVVVAQDQWVFPEREPTPHDQSYAHMPSFSVHGEEVMVSAPRTCVGNTGSEEISERPSGSIFDRQNVVVSLIKEGAVILSRHGLRPGDVKLHPKLALAGMEVGLLEVVPFPLHADGHLPRHLSRSLFALPASLGLDIMIQTWLRPRLCMFSPIVLPPGVLVQKGLAVRDQLTLNSPILTGPNMASKYLGSPGRPSAVNPDQDGPQSEVVIIHPWLKPKKLLDWPLRGTNSQILISQPRLLRPF